MKQGNKTVYHFHCAKQGTEVPEVFGPQLESTVQDNCEGEHGYWACLLHGEVFHEPAGLQVHLDNGETTHVLAWYCLIHGYFETAGSA